MLGMEFPDNAAINVHRIVSKRRNHLEELLLMYKQGRIYSVHWILYSPVDSIITDHVSEKTLSLMRDI